MTGPSRVPILFLPAIPHYASECLEEMQKKEKIEWPDVNEDLLVEDKIDYVIQINGKKRAILNESRDIDRESLLVKVKTNKVSKKYLINKSINKVIFIKNRLMNILIND